MNLETEDLDLLSDKIVLLTSELRPETEMCLLSILDWPESNRKCLFVLAFCVEFELLLFLELARDDDSEITKSRLL